MPLYSFHRLNRRGEADSSGMDIECADDSLAHGWGWQIITDEPNLPGVDIWDGPRKVARLTRYLKPAPE